MSNSLKIKTVFNEDIRVYKCEYINNKELFNGLKTFIQKSYKINNLNNIIMQYKDDENDLITIANDSDLQDTIEQFKSTKKTIKIFIKQTATSNNNNNSNSNANTAKTDNDDKKGYNINNNNNNNNPQDFINNLLKNIGGIGAVGGVGGVNGADLSNLIGQFMQNGGCKNFKDFQGFQYGGGRQFKHGGRKHGGRKYGRYGGSGYNNENNRCMEDNRFIANIIENPMPLISSEVNPNEGIIKKWKIRNDGKIAFPVGLIVKYSGRKNNPMVSSQTFYVGNTKEILPGESFTVQICIKTPQEYGRFSSNWRLSTPDGKKFGQKLPFYLVLSPPNNDNNNDNNSNKAENDDSKYPEEENNDNNNNNNDNNMKAEKEENDENNDENKEEEENNKENDDITNELIQMVIKESKNDKQEKKEDDVIKNNDDNNDNNDNNNKNEEEPEIIDMEESSDNDEEPIIKEPESEAEADKIPEKLPSKIEEPKEIEVYQYQAQLDEIKLMGFGKDGSAKDAQFIKDLLNKNNGDINAVIPNLLQ